MSDHVVVSRDLLCRVLKHWSKRPDGDETDVEISFILAQPSPEMVPMSDVQELIKALTTISKLPGSWAIADDALAAFNAKFKP